MLVFQSAASVASCGPPFYLSDADVRMLDVGDVEIVHTDMEKSHANTKAAVSKIPVTQADGIWSFRLINRGQ